MRILTRDNDGLKTAIDDSARFLMIKDNGDHRIVWYKLSNGYEEKLQVKETLAELLPGNKQL